MSKTHFKKLKNPNFVGSWDLADDAGNYHDKNVTIVAVKKDTVHDGRGGSDECTIVELKETKPMVANSTNLRAIAKIAGSPYIEDWVGKVICLTVRKVKAFGEVHDAIRVNKPAAATTQAKKTLPQERFENALKSIESGDIDKQTILDRFDLTAEQTQQLNKIWEEKLMERYYEAEKYYNSFVRENEKK